MTLKNNELLSDFREILAAQLYTYIEVLKLAKQKTDVLVSGDVKVLEQITDIEQGMIIKLGKLEEQWTSNLEQIASRNKKDIDELNVDFFISILPSKEAEEISKFHDDLKDVLAQIDQANRTNEQLINKALEYINFSIGLLTDAGSDTSNYGADGQNSDQKTFHFIDKKA